MNIYEYGIMDKLVYPNTITDKACKSLVNGRRALGGRIREGNSQGGHIVQGVTERAVTMNSVRIRPGGGGIGGSPLDLSWKNNPSPSEPQLYRVYLSKLACSIGPPVGCCRGRAKKCTYLQIHFVNRHMQDIFVVMEGSNLPNPVV